jgi:predicted ATPase/class 3 adenylate cyclase/Tfp pilus assembly protein PilF
MDDLLPGPQTKGLWLESAVMNDHPTPISLYPYSGTLTFLFTDVVGSTRLWEQYTNQMRQTMVRHDEIIESLVAYHRGNVVRPRGEGDSRFAVFGRATDAVVAAIQIQRSFSEEPWSIPMPLKVRIALHTGEAELREGDYYGPAVNRCARLRSVAHGGQTLLSQATYNLINDALPDGITLFDLGEHSLKDLIRTERIYQLNISGLPAEFPKLQTKNNSYTNLPITLTSFIGRENEIHELKELLKTRRMLTIFGSGGSGKTRLAIQVANDLTNSFPDGVWFVDLSPLSNSTHISSYIMSDLGIREEVNSSPERALIDFMRGKSMLLFLDNCEHILSGVTPLVDMLLREASNLSILATSRTPIGVVGEMVWRIPPLATPELNCEIPLEKLVQFEAVKLFVERAVSARADFTMTSKNAFAIARICARLDGIPLAIELAAARVRILSVIDIATRLDDRFRLLVSPQNAIPRHKTLRSLIDWSYDMLPEKERILLRRLSIFAGGWTLNAAEEICADGNINSFEILDLLANLVDKSLVIAETKGGGERYHFLETIRQYAQERLLESQDMEEFPDRHAQYFTAIVEEAFGQLWGQNQAHWLEQLESEHDNLRSAMDWLTQMKIDDDRLLRLATSLWRFWEIRGYLNEGRARLEVALEHSPTSSHLLRGQALRGAGMLAFQQGDYERATALHGQSLSLFRDIGDKLGIGRELSALGEIAKIQGNYSQSIELHTESLAIRHEIADKEGVAVSLGHLGIIARDRGQYPYARELLEESLRLSRELKDKLMTAQALQSLGLVAFNLCEYPRATDLFEEASTLYRELNDRLGISNALQHLGTMAKDQGDFQRATALYKQYLELKRELGDRHGIAQAISNQAEVYFYQGNYPRAAELVEEGLSLFKELGVKRGILYCLGLQAYIAHYQGDYQRAQSLAAEVLNIATAMDAPRPVAYAKEVFGLGAYIRGEYVTAKTSFEEALLIFQKLNDRRNVASLWVNLARTAYRQGDRDCAMHYLDESMSLSRELDARWTTSLVLEIKGLLEREAGRYDQASQLFIQSLHLSIEQVNHQGIANCLGALAGIATLIGQPTRAARLFAAAEKSRKMLGAQMGKGDREEYEHYLGTLREQISQAEFEAAWSEGFHMTIEQITPDLTDLGSE